MYFWGKTNIGHNCPPFLCKILFAQFSITQVGKVSKNHRATMATLMGYVPGFAGIYWYFISMIIETLLVYAEKKGPNEAFDFLTIVKYKKTSNKLDEVGFKCLRVVILIVLWHFTRMFRISKNQFGDFVNSGFHFFSSVSSARRWDQCRCQMWQQFHHLLEHQSPGLCNAAGLLKFTQGALGPLLSSQRQIFSSLTLQDLCLWFRASHPDCPCNLFTAASLHFSSFPSCFPEREHDVSIDPSNTEGDTEWEFLKISGNSSCSQNCQQSLSKARCPMHENNLYRFSNTSSSRVWYFFQGHLSGAEATVGWS